MLGHVNEERTQAATWIEEANAATPVDWRTEGAVNPIKDQGGCGSCWAFSAIQAYEFSHWKSTGTLDSFSEQQVVSCAGRTYGNYGCNGGNSYRAYNYLEKFDVELEASYPYTSGGGKNGRCLFE